MLITSRMYFMQNSTNVHQQLQNMLFTPILLLRAQKQNLLARRRLRGLIVFVFAHDTQIQVAHALCKLGPRRYTNVFDESKINRIR